MIRVVSVVLVAAVAGCGSSGRGGGGDATVVPAGPSSVSYTDEGHFCLTVGPLVGPIEAMTLPADEALHVHVAVNECLSSSCDTLEKAECSVQVSGQMVTIRSEFRIHFKSGSCTTDCKLPTAECLAPALPAGTYTFKSGNETRTVEIGSGTTPACSLSDFSS